MKECGRAVSPREYGRAVSPKECGRVVSPNQECGGIVALLAHLSPLFEALHYKPSILSLILVVRARISLCRTILLTLSADVTLTVPSALLLAAPATG